MDIQRHRSGLVLTIAATAALTLAACSGGAASPGAATPTTAGTGAPAATAAATPAPTTDGANPAPSVAIAIPSFDLGKLGGAIPGLDSYRVSVSTEGTKQYESVVVTSPEVAKHITTFKDDGTADSEFIIIGDQAWTKDSGGTWESMPSQMAQAMLMAFDPATMFAAYATANWAGGAHDVGSEDKNGIPSHHFSIDPTAALGAALPSGTSVDLWVADAGHIVALEITSDGKQALAVEISNVNDPANQVEAPTS